MFTSGFVIYIVPSYQLRTDSPWPGLCNALVDSKQAIQNVDVSRSEHPTNMRQDTKVLWHTRKSCRDKPRDYLRNVRPRGMPLSCSVATY